MSGPTALSWPHNVPVLRDGNVTLRAHSDADIDRIVELCRDPESVRWTTIPTPYGRADAEGFLRDVIAPGWETGTAMGWAVDFDGRYVGNIDIRGPGPLGEIGYVLHPDARGHGVMRRAVVLALEYAFGTGGKQAVDWTAVEGNAESLRVAHASGFTLDARIPDAVEQRGTIRAAWRCSIRAGDSFEPKTTWRATTFFTERFRLRPLAERDDERIRETLDDPISRKYLFARPDPLLIEHAAAERARKWWTAARGETCTWAVADIETDDYLGDITLLGINPTTGAEIGFYTHPEARGKGVLGDTIPAVVRHAFGVLLLRRLTLFAAASNTGSRKLAQNSGLHEFGTQPLAAKSDGVYEDLVGYELLRSDASWD